MLLPTPRRIGAGGGKLFHPMRGHEPRRRLGRHATGSHRRHESTPQDAAAPRSEFEGKAAWQERDRHLGDRRLGGHPLVTDCRRTPPLTRYANIAGALAGANPSGQADHHGGSDGSEDHPGARTGIGHAVKSGLRASGRERVADGRSRSAIDRSFPASARSRWLGERRRRFALIEVEPAAKKPRHG